MAISAYEEKPQDETAWHMESSPGWGRPGSMNHEDNAKRRYTQAQINP
jgi:hypothetical protein